MNVKLNREGWSKPPGETLYHFFRDGQSLCNKVAFDGEVLLPYIDLGPNLVCMECTKLRLKK